MTLIGLMAGGSIATPTFAQTAASPDHAGPVETIGEVVVTSRRRAERLQEVPLAITAITADQLNVAGAKDLQDVLNQTPGVTLFGTPAESNQNPVIRGEANLNDQGGAPPNVAVFADGIYIQNNSAYSLGLLDLDRVEIVKGPVSALYGRTGFAGAINYVSKKPTDDFHSTGDVELGQYGRYNVTADVNGPIVAGLLRAGLGIYYGTADGDYEDSVTGQRAGGFEKKDIKGTFDYTPTSKLDISGGYYYGDDHFDASPIGFLSGGTPCTSDQFGAFGVPPGPAICGKLSTAAPQISDIPASSGNSGNTRKVQSANLKISYDLGWADVTYLGGYNRVIDTAYEDFTGMRYGIPFPLANATTGVQTGASVNLYELFGVKQNSEDFSQEIRLASKQYQPLRWSIGGDYFQSQTGDATLVGIDGAGIPAGDVIYENPAYYFNNEFVTATGSADPLHTSNSAGTDQNYSFFGSVDYDIIPGLTASGEVRYSHDAPTVDIQHNVFYGFGATYQPFGPETKAVYNYTNYRGTLRYKISNHAMVYGSVATGTKPGGFNLRPDIPADVAYGPESNIAYEIGTKTDFFERKLQIDASFYYVESKHVQIDVAPAVGFVDVVKNVGGTNNGGFELSSIYSPFKGVSFTAGLAYTDPKFTSGSYDYGNTFFGLNIPTACATLAPASACPGKTVLVTAPGGTAPVTSTSLKGLQEEFTSKITLNLAADLNGNIMGPYDWFAHVDYRYQTKQYYQLDDIYYIGDSSLVNVNAGVKWDHFKASIYCKNLTDDKTPSIPQTAFEINGAQENFAYLPDRRNVGVELSYRY